LTCCQSPLPNRFCRARYAVPSPATFVRLRRVAGHPPRHPGRGRTSRGVAPRRLRPIVILTAGKDLVVGGFGARDASLRLSMRGAGETRSSRLLASLPSRRLAVSPSCRLRQSG
jgi:hypothetical protein